jgi:ribosomal protein S6--L-glutamate ligase
MKIALLASNPKLYSNVRIIETAKNRGHQIEFIDIGGCYIKVSSAVKNINQSADSEIYYHGGRSLKDIEAVIPRIKPSITFYGTVIIRQFELNQVYCLNKSDQIIKSRDKLWTLQLLAAQGINIPTTSFANSFYETKDLIKLVGGAPLVVKLLEGTKGIGVVLAENTKAAESVINAFRSLKADILVQHYIKESKGRDIRCFVIGDKVVASMQRIGEEGEFRANIHLGGKGEAVEITQEERQMAIKATKTIGLDVAGVDMVRSVTGPKILEINSSPGLEGIEAATNIDIASKMIEFLEKKYCH